MAVRSLSSRHRRRGSVRGWSGVWTVGVGVGVRTKRCKLVGRGVHVGEGVDRGECGLCGGHMATGLGLCLAPGLDRRLAGVGGFRGKEGRRRPRAGRPLSEAPAGRVVNRGGWVGQKSGPPAGPGQVRGVLAPAARAVSARRLRWPVLDAEAVHLGLVVEVMVRRLQVVGRRRDHD